MKDGTGASRRDGRGIDRATTICAIAWIALAVMAPWHVVAESRSAAVGVTVIAWGWFGWTAVATALLAGAPVSLTIVRLAAPLSLVVAMAARSPWSTAAAVTAITASFAPSFADRMVQGGAYGRETRFALRTPVPQMAPASVAWLVLVGCLIGGSLLVAARSLIVGIPLAVAGLVLVTRTPRHLHRLSRRWLVVVPAGIVVHDHVVLGETFMVRTPRIASMAICPATGESADLTGGVTGSRLLIAMTEADKVVLSPITARTLGTTEALHVLSFTVAPRRPATVMATLGR